MNGCRNQAVALGTGAALAGVCAAMGFATWGRTDLSVLWWSAAVVWSLGGAAVLRSGPAAWPRVPVVLRWLLGLCVLVAAWMAMANARERGVNFLLSVMCIVWAADITYIPMQRGFVYLCAILDWASRRVLAWRLSNTLTTDFCLEAVQEAITRYGLPEIFNTDQGCQFTSQEFTGLLQAHGIQISRDGTGRWPGQCLRRTVVAEPQIGRGICTPTRPWGLRGKAWLAI